jgi:hypothetical protein
MKGCLVQLRVMLADAAPWYLPALVLALVSWLGAAVIEPRCRSRPWVRRLYFATPIVMLGGLVAHRAAALLLLNAEHNEVALYLGSSATVAERLQVLFTGFGGVEGAMVALGVFALASPFLPSLRQASEATKDFVRVGMMTHSALWVLLGMLLLFPTEAHGAATSLPENPTLSVPSWTVFGWIAAFTLLVMMAGEVLVGTARMASNNETKTLVNRALMKTMAVGLLAWWAVFQTDVFTQGWWPRPMQAPHPHAALLVAGYATLVTLFHAPLVDIEHRFSQHPKQARTLGLGLLLAAALLLWMTWMTLAWVPNFGNSAVRASTGWRLVSVMYLPCGLLMMLPSLGYDAAQRPEAWWFRIGWLAVVAAGPLLSPTAWLLLPGLFMAAAGLVLLPVLLEAPVLLSPMQRVGGPAVFLTVVFALPWLAGSARATLFIGLMVLVFSNAVSLLVLRRWGSNAAKESVV